MARTKAQLRSLFPRFRGIEGISVFRAEDYVLAAERARLKGDDLEHFLELAMERHRKAVDRQASENVRYYGTTRNCGRNRRLKDRVRAGNLAAVRSIQLELDERQIRKSE